MFIDLNDSICKTTTSIVLFALLAVGVTVDIRVRDTAESTVTTCRTILAKITTFCANDNQKFHTCICQTPQDLGSWLNCA
jgi:hypothetical protein